MKPFSASEILAHMTQLLTELPPAPFNGANRLVVAPDVMRKLRQSDQVIERMGAPYLGSVSLEQSHILPAGQMMGFNRQGEIVWSNRFDAAAAWRAA